MRKGARLHMVAACGGLVIVLLWLVFADTEPSADGHRLSYWLNIGRIAAVPYWGDEVQLEARNQSERAKKAVQQMGPNAVPCLMKWMRYKPSPLRQRLTAILAKHRDKPPGSWTFNWLVSGGQRQDMAVLGFEWLGASGGSARPELTRMAVNPAERDTAVLAFHALENMGAESLPAVLEVLANPTAPPRAMAAYSLVRWGTNAAPAIPVLLKCLKDKDEEVAGTAAAALGTLRLQPDIVLPALISALQDPRFGLRISAAQGIWGYQNEALPAIPALVRARHDSHPGVREQVAAVLRDLAPEVLTNTPAHSGRAKP